MAQCVFMRNNRSFSATVRMQVNPNAIIWLIHAREPRYRYWNAADSTGYVEIDVGKAGEYDIRSTADSGKSKLSTNPASVSKISVKRNGSKTDIITHVYVGDIGNIVCGGWSTNTAYVYWTKPEENYNGMRVQFEQDTIPVDIFDGGNSNLMGEGIGEERNISSSIKRPSFIKALTNGNTYYFSGWPFYTLNGVKYYGQKYDAGPYTAVVTPDATREFLSNGTYTVPNGVRKVSILTVGAGGSGGTGRLFIGTGEDSHDFWNGGGGGQGGNISISTVDVTPGDSLSITVGVGGTGSHYGCENGKVGSATSVYRGSTVLSSAAGGGYGVGAARNGDRPGNGGTGSGYGDGGRGAAPYGSGTEWAAIAGGGGYSYLGTVFCGGGGGGGSLERGNSGQFYVREPAAGGGSGGKGGVFKFGSAGTGYNGTAGTAGRGGGGGGGAGDNSQGGGVWSGAGGSGYCRITPA